MACCWIKKQTKNRPTAILPRIYTRCIAWRSHTVLTVRPVHTTARFNFLTTITSVCTTVTTKNSQHRPNQKNCLFVFILKYYRINIIYYDELRVNRVYKVWGFQCILNLFLVHLRAQKSLKQRHQEVCAHILWLTNWFWKQRKKEMTECREYMQDTKAYMVSSLLLQAVSSLKISH